MQRGQINLDTGGRFSILWLPISTTDFITDANFRDTYGSEFRDMVAGGAYEYTGVDIDTGNGHKVRASIPAVCPLFTLTHSLGSTGW